MQTDQPKYSINALKTWNTHDGGGYQGNLLRDGKAVGRFHNDGNGGETFVEFWIKTKTGATRNTKEEEIFYEHIKTLPEREWPKEWVQDGESSTYKVNADMFIADLVGAFEQMRYNKRICAKKTLFLLKSDNPEEGWRIINHPYSDQIKMHLSVKYGDQIAEILNETIKS